METALVSRVLTMADVSAVYYRTADEITWLADGILRELRGIPCIDNGQGQRDAAGIAVRGGSVFIDVLRRRPWPAIEAAAARRYLIEHNAQRTVLDQIENMPVY